MVSDDDVLVYRDPNLDGEFSLLRPHLEFNELALRELFTKEGRAGSCSSTNLDMGLDSEPGSTSAGGSGSSHLFGDLEEVQIRHFQPPNELSSREDPSGSPFFLCVNIS